MDSATIRAGGDMICNRRTFFMAASGLALGARAAMAGAQGASNRIRIGVIGTGGRARSLMSLLKKLPGNEMVAVCDVYEPRVLQAAEIAGPTATKVADYRRILDDREIDAVVIGTPDHWHKAITLDAVAAGKDVYVEKPISHSIAEGAEMVKAVEASKQIVQTGTQQRSWDHWQLGKQIVESGRLGQITFVQTYWYQHATAGDYPPVEMDQARLETVARSGAGSAVPPGALLSVASLLGFRRRLPDRPHDPLDRRRALVHGRRCADVGGGHRAQLQHQARGKRPTPSPRPSSSRRTS